MLRIMDQDCTQINKATAFMTIAGLTLLLGLMFVVAYKVKTHLEDQRLYRLFQEEQMNQTSYEMTSPLYKSPVSEFQVPKEIADIELK